MRGSIRTSATVVLTSAWTVAMLNAVPAVAASDERPVAAAADKSPPRWSSLITAKDLHDRQSRPDLAIIDVRAASEYEAGHIPGAINLPGAEWRTAAAKPGSGVIGQQVFRGADGSFDVARYEKLLGAAGIKATDETVVYGNHAGKADGSVPAAILLKLGHDKVAFLDGLGLEQWKKAGYPVSKEAVHRPATTYVARPDKTRLWAYEDVLKNINNPDVVFVDSRTPEEFAGVDLRGNKNGGHIPGAKLLNSEELLDKHEHTVIAPDEARKRINAALGSEAANKDKTIVIYCQTGTRCSEEELIFKDLGFKNVILYDGSWQDWGNREGAPIEKPSGDKPVAEKSPKKPTETK